MGGAELADQKTHFFLKEKLSCDEFHDIDDIGGMRKKSEFRNGWGNWCTWRDDENDNDDGDTMAWRLVVGRGRLISRFPPQAGDGVE